MNEHNRFLWEFTAEEWLGPRIKLVDTDKDYAAGQRQTESLRAGSHERVRVADGIWAEHSYWGSLIFETETSSRVIGTLSHDGLSTIDPEFAGRGIATQVAVDGLFRMAKTAPLGYLQSRFESVSIDGERYTIRLYIGTVKRAVAEGKQVQQKVLDSAKDIVQRYEALRRGDDSALDQLGSKERRRKKNCGRVTSRYRWVTVRESFMEWLRKSNKPLQVRRFEDMVVVVPD